jgi:signal transduction histidine kinase
VSPNDRHRHDLRNQLGIILGFTALLLTESKSGDPGHGELEEIHMAAQTSLSLIDRVFPAAQALSS